MITRMKPRVFMILQLAHSRDFVKRVKLGFRGPSQDYYISLG